MGITRRARFTRRLITVGTATYALMTLAMLVWTFLWPDPDISTIGPADAIICLGGGMDARGVLAPSTLKRVDRCVDLHKANLAPAIIFTGGAAAPNGPSAGSQMGRYALSLGLPAHAAIQEQRAQSTLQNALFSYQLLPNPTRLIVVTEAFHLPRAWASLKWAAWETGAPLASLTLVKSENLRRDPATGRLTLSMLARESIAIWFNLARAAAYSVATRAGWAPDGRDAWLH